MEEAGGIDARDVMIMEDYREEENQAETTEYTYQEKDWEAIVEAVLFTMGQSVELSQLAVAIDQNEKTARTVVEKLMARYEKEERGIQIIELENSYQMCTKARFYENLIRVASAPKKNVLTEVTLETLSIIAYKQPVTKLEIEKIRGVKSDHAVNRLIEYNLVQEIGRLDAPGRPALFATTEEFLRRFGIGGKENLPDIDPVRQEEIKNEVEESVATGHEFDECTEVENRTDGTVVYLAFFGLGDDRFDFGESRVNAALVFRCDLHFADAEFLVFIDRYDSAGLFLDSLNDFTLRSDYCTNHLLWYLKSDKARNM